MRLIGLLLLLLMGTVEAGDAHYPVIDHLAWQELLDRYLQQDTTGINRFHYADVTIADRVRLQTYINDLTEKSISDFSRAERLAYWINLYNALTVELILGHYPVRSIRDIDISPGWFSNGPWGKQLITVEGRGLSLDGIEHQILRVEFEDPRIHYAVNCASLGCPNLASQAYRPDDLEAQLDTAAESYINHPRGVNLQDGRLVISSLYKWYREDFGETDADVIRHLQRYASPSLRTELESGSTIDGYRYDWRLNDPH